MRKGKQLPLTCIVLSFSVCALQQYTRASNHFLFQMLPDGRYLILHPETGSNLELLFPSKQDSDVYIIFPFIVQ
jgi:hypothetical protein